MKPVLLTDAAYVAAVFAAGFVLSVLRTLVLVPLLGELGAVLVELPVILTIAWLVCTRILRRWRLLPRAAAAMGAIAFLLLMLAEASHGVLAGSARPVDPVSTSARRISRVFSGSSKKGVWADCLKV